MSQQFLPEGPPVHIIIAHWNDEETTVACLERLSKLEYSPFAVTVVDSGSTDGSGTRIRDRFPWVHVTHLPENRGHSHAANAGVVMAGEDFPYLFFLDNDAYVEPKCLRILIDTLEASLGSAMACPLILSERKPGRVWYAGGYITWLGVARHVKMGKKFQAFDPSAKPVEFATSCALLVRRSVFERLGGFNEDLVGYSEDLHLSIKVRRAGYEILFVPKARVLHGESRNVIKIAGKPFRDYYTLRNSLHIIRRYGTTFQRSAGLLCIILWYGAMYSCIHLLRGEYKRVRARVIAIQDFFRNRLGWREL